MLPDVASARAMLDELLLARIEERRIRFCAKEGSLPAGMPEINSIHKTDMVHGVERGILVGGVSGLIAGGLLFFFPLDVMLWRALAMLALGVAGALIGSWIDGKAAATIPNSRLQPFRAGIADGQVLLMVDVPFRRVTEIEEMIAKRHPEIRCGGMEHHIPVLS
ncbi:MAG: DUF1269 domain-containing protein [Burkholderiales bacterium]|nr:DUF1269 domain-containing protein [Burkholderiales bacterium]